MNKIIINVNGILLCTLSYLRVYCSMSQNFETFSTPQEGLFLVFGVSNAKYLAFGTPDENALKRCQLIELQILHLKGKNLYAHVIKHTRIKYLRSI